MRRVAGSRDGVTGCFRARPDKSAECFVLFVVSPFAAAIETVTVHKLIKTSPSAGFDKDLTTRTALPHPAPP